MQFLHFTYAVGGILGPLATEPFLTPIPEDTNSSFSLQAPYNDTSVLATNVSSIILSWNTPENTTHITKGGYSSPPVLRSNTSSFIDSLNTTWNSADLSKPMTTEVHYAYVIAGCLTLLTALPFAGQLFTNQKLKRRRQDSDENEKQQSVKQPLPFFVFIIVTGQK